MQLKSYIKGDSQVWSIIAILSIVSLVIVYSASSNLAYINSTGSTFKWLTKQSVHLILGLSFTIGISKLNYKYFGPIALMAFPFVLILLGYTSLQGIVSDSASATNTSRWISIPFIGVSFQTSSLANLALITYLARYLSKNDVSKYTFKETLVPVLLPVAIVCGLVVLANFSTAAMIFLISFVVLYIAGYPLKYLGYVIGMGVAAFGLLLLVFTAFPNISNRMDTWKARIESYASGDSEDNYQVERAKMAIANGGAFGKGPGKSVLKNFLPQSSSDFIYAILIEEYGAVGGIIILGLYIWLFIRFAKIARKAPSPFGTYLVIGIGSAFVIQALINMSVVVNLIPVTGQTLPLISAGGSSIWITCIGLGMILSVSNASSRTSNKNGVENNNNLNTLDIEPAV